jgi:hypothetical protein
MRIAVSIIQENNENYPGKKGELSKKEMRIIQEKNENNRRRECSLSLQTAHKL